jgi:CheY-specific phosphatase CheX
MIDHEFANAIIGGTSEILEGQKITSMHSTPELRPAGATSGEIVAMLSYRSSIAGDLCFKCSLDFARLVYTRIFGPLDDSVNNEILADTIAELLNWISGTIKKRYEQGSSIVISTPMVFVNEATHTPEALDAGGDMVTVIEFQSGEHTFTVELLVDEEAAQA